MLDTKKAYVRFIGHELRTPLHSVFMGLQLSIDQIPEDTQVPIEIERKETLVETQSACGAALDILNELLLFDKLETGALVLHKQSVPVTELVEDSVRMFSAQAREKSIELSITNNDEAMLESSVDAAAAAQLELHDTDEVSVDKNKVVQVIRNVVSNAIKFTPASGKIQVNLKFVFPLKLTAGRAESPIVLLGCRPTRVTPGNNAENGQDAAIDVVQTPSSSQITRRVSGELIIEVRDSGAGISEENQRRLFKEVVQFNPELLQNGGGSGLGMCISKGIMDMHGGSISVHSAGEGQGCVFTLRLPMTRHESQVEPRVYVPVSTSVLSRPTMVLPPTLTSGHTVDQPPNSFSITLSSNKSAVSTSRPSSNVTTTRPLHFLVVDDSKMNRKMLCRLLQNKGHESTEAEDGVQAVTMITAALESSPITRGIAGATRSAKRAEALTTLDSSRTDPGASGTTVYDAILMDFM